MTTKPYYCLNCYHEENCFCKLHEFEINPEEDYCFDFLDNTIPEETEND